MFSPLNRISPVMLGGARQQPQQAERDRGLAAARLAGHAHRLAGLQGEADAAHRAHGLAARAVGHRQVAYLQQRSRRQGLRVHQLPPAGG